MVLAAGTITQQSVGATTATLTVSPATGGTGPYTNQWYRSQTPGFTPGGGNIIAGATALTLNDSGLIPNSSYYYKVVQTDTGHSNDQVTASQLALQSAPPTQSQNQFAQTPYLGMPDLLVNPNTVSMEIDKSQATPLYAGAFVKVVDSAGGIPKIVGLAAGSDEVAGVINYDPKSINFPAGARCEVDLALNCVWLYATAAISRFEQVVPDLTTNGGVKAVTGSTGFTIVGYAYDKATAPGQLIRVVLNTPSFQLDS